MKLEGIEKTEVTFVDRDVSKLVPREEVKMYKSYYAHFEKSVLDKMFANLHHDASPPTQSVWVYVGRIDPRGEDGEPTKIFLAFNHNGKIPKPIKFSYAPEYFIPIDNPIAVSFTLGEEK